MKAGKFSSFKIAGRWNSIAAKLYGLALLSLLAVACLVVAALYFSTTTERAAQRLYGDGFFGVTASTNLELLLERHRRIVESMPSEADRQKLLSQREELEAIKVKLTNLIRDINARTADAVLDSLEVRIADSLPPLFDGADKVAFYANEFAQDIASQQAEVYSRAANNTQYFIHGYRELRLEEADQAIRSVRSAVKSLTIWVLALALFAICLLGPIGLTSIYRILSRLRAITSATVRIANNETDTDVPSSNDGDEVGAMARAVEIFKDNAVQLLSRELELKQLNGRMDLALNNMTHGLCMFDAHKNLIVCNKIFLTMFGLSDQLGKPGTSLETVEQSRYNVGTGTVLCDREPAAESNNTSALGRSCFTEQLEDGRVIATSQQPMAEGGWVTVYEDITEQRRANEKILHLARHDMLTNLPNRVLFRERLEREFANTESDSGFAVHYLDLDNFKNVNDTFGHPIGDELLKIVASRLKAVVSRTEFVARFGGDEFAIVQTGVKTPQQCSALASRIIERIGEPYDIEGRHIVIGTSIGIAIAPADGKNSDQLLKNADMALYLAKGDGRGMHRFFEKEMDQRLQARRGLEFDMRKAITNGEFEVYYQPIICLKTGEVKTFEALVRWNHPVRGQIAPGEFIELAEETGLILPLGEWVLRTACQHASAWPSNISVAVNLSATQFKGLNLVQTVVNALASNNLPAGRLELEITETTLLHDEANTLSILAQLRAIGISMSLDDFGTGYSSLAYLRNFPFDKIKIDQSFVRDILVRKDCQAIVRAVVGMAKSMEMTTIIEGIETAEQKDAATKFGCDEGQGYLFSKPMPESRINHFLKERQSVSHAA